MKQKFYLLIIISLLFLGKNEVFSQRADYSAKSGFDLGFGLGTSYQKSDIRNFSGGGGTFTFGHSIYQEKNAFFGLDWRFRFLGGQNMAYDDRMNIDSTYNNVKYTHFNYDLEFVLTLNRLRENTRIIVSGFAGAGVTHNITHFDFSNDGEPYDYSVINPDGSDGRIAIYNDLHKLSDNNFETAGINKGCIAPTLGLYLGYQITPRFSMGIEHKTNYFLEEKNSLIGANIDGIVSPIQAIDKNHYTAIYLKWDIGDDSEPNIPCNNPEVNININEVKSQFATHELNGTISNVDNASNINLNIDGIPNNNFYFDSYSKRISCSFNLSPGTHTVSILANNKCGQDEMSVQVSVNQPCIPPVVEFAVYNSNSVNITHQLRGVVSNIKNKNDISILIDGNKDFSFQFDLETNSIVSDYNFAPGTHSIVVTATNECGKDTQSGEVIINGPCIPPVINFSVPELTLNNFSHQLVGTVTNISNQNQITVSLDGNLDNSFQFIAGTNAISANYNFAPGTHSIVVNAKNECGEDSKSVQVTVAKPCSVPVLQIAITEIKGDKYNFHLAGSVTNIKNKQELTVTIDGKLNNTFAFDPNTNSISANYLFSEGEHKIVVVAKNECGQTSETVTVNNEKPCNPPEIKLSVVKSLNVKFTHQLTGNISNIKNKNEINISVDGNPDATLLFDINTKTISSSYRFTPGTHTIIVTAKNDCGNDSETTQVIVEEPCIAPSLKLAVTEINDLNFTHQLTGIAANINNKNEITITVDGVLNNKFEFTLSTREIKANYKLAQGTHTIVVFAKNECGEDTERVQVLVAVPCAPPVVNFKVSEIADNNYTHQLSGTVTNIKNKTDITVKVDGVLDNNFQFVASTNQLSGKYKLAQGTHTIVVFAKNECGEDTERVQVLVAVPCAPPVVNFKVSEIADNNFTHQLSGTVTNIKNKTDITVKVDGVLDNSFQFVPSTNQLSGKYKLAAGEHKIVVTAKNECGDDTETNVVIVKVPCAPPVVNFKVSEIADNNFTHQLSGTVTNIKNKTDITVKVDGVLDNSFQFVPSTNQLTGKYKLAAGEHKIVVTAKNECGNDTETNVVIVKAPCAVPVVNFKVSEIADNNFTHQLSGTVTNIKNKTDITVKVDGVLDNSFQFVPNTNQLTGKYKLSPGEHKIVVTAKNECGDDTETNVVIVKAPCAPPVVNFKVDASTFKNISHQLTGSVSNVTAKDQITITVDGTRNDVFQFSSANNSIISTYNFSSGTHTIVVFAKNDCGEDTERVQVLVAAPCISPVVNFKVSEIADNNFTHQLSGTVTNIKNKTDITVKVDGVLDNSFQFVPSTNQLSGKYKLSPGEHKIIVTAKNECGDDAETNVVIVDKEEGNDKGGTNNENVNGNKGRTNVVTPNDNSTPKEGTINNNKGGTGNETTPSKVIPKK